MISQDIWARFQRSPVVEQSAEDKPADEKRDDTQPVKIIEQPLPLKKGDPVRVFTNQQANQTSDVIIDMRNFNALHIDVWVLGTSPSATLKVQGADAVGNYLTLPDSRATQTAVTANTSFEVVVGCQFAKVDLSAISGTFGTGQGYTIIATPFVGDGYGTVAISQGTPGTTNAIDIKTTANTALDSTNKVPVSLYGKGTAAGDTTLALESTTNPNLRVSIWNAATEVDILSGVGDAVGTSNIGIVSSDLVRMFNGSTWDRYRGNTEGTLLASAARTATTASPDQVNYNGRGVRVRINVTAVGAAPSITVAIQEKDSISGNYVNILVSAAITTTGQKTSLVLYPGATGVVNAVLGEPLPRTWRVNVTHGNSDSITYSIDSAVIL